MLAQALQSLRDLQKIIDTTSHDSVRIEATLVMLDAQGVIAEILHASRN